MSINLLTSVPGGGKTSYAVWNIIKKAHEESKIIYTIGIPKLTLPTIELTYDQVKNWFKNDINEKSGLPELQNIEHGSIIVIDEVQKLWPALGSKISEDIKELSVHRHYGLTFFLITQAPNLIHRNVLALVDKHLHIRVTWAGRKIYEWPEFTRSPSTESARRNAVVFNYKLPKESFELYHSATQHVKPKKNAPMAFFVFVVALLSTLAFGAYAVQRVMNKLDIQSEEIAQEEFTAENEIDFSTVPLAVPENGMVPENIQQPIKQYFNTQLLSEDIDWSNVSACLANSGSCVCYGQSAQRLIIPKETCELAVMNGWTRKGG
ncbi:zonular occludens toxin domain-containing protein [Nitrosomonas ureae]|uniref:Zona occludens toxin n=1 Tax=Nitrosomonas ureae TaxID=44577 RepID=A0A2T5I7C2_9PROT|nr:zonular occludens toxin domain-containing protein [Nitrosomonas ureae]PTQ79709.1 zona occludens toxin [Nitrosomonas ureae]